YVRFAGLFPDPPLKPLDSIYLFFSVEAIGFGYFMPLDVTFSTWFFFLLEKLLAIALLAAGYDRAGLPFLQEQSTRAYLITGVLRVVRRRRRLVRVWRRAFLKPRAQMTDAEREARWAWLGLSASALFLLWFMTRTGLPVRLALPYLTILACFMLVYARLRAET